MISAVDANILLDVMVPGSRFGKGSKALLDAAYQSGAVIISAVACAEFGIGFHSSEGLDRFLADTGYRIDPIDSEVVGAVLEPWKKYLADRKHGKESQTETKCICGRNVTMAKAILADFLIAAHAITRANALLTRDNRGLYRRYFPELRCARALTAFKEMEV